MGNRRTKIHVLIADDHQLVLFGLRRYLDAQPDLRVVGLARNGLEALRIAVKLEPDVVVMDVEMPVLDGVESTERIRRVCASVRVIALTGTGQKHLAAMRKAGAWAHISKEVHPSEVARVIRLVRRGRRVFPGAPSERVVSEPDVGLTRRERDVLVQIARGLSSKQAAELLGIGTRTVETYRDKIAKKVGTRSVAALARFAVSHGLVPNGDS